MQEQLRAGFADSEKGKEVMSAQTSDHARTTAIILGRLHDSNSQRQMIRPSRYCVEVDLTKVSGAGGLKPTADTKLGSVRRIVVRASAKKAATITTNSRKKKVFWTE